MQFCKIKLQNQPSPQPQQKTLNTNNRNHQCYVCIVNVPKSITDKQYNCAEQQLGLQNGLCTMKLVQISLLYNETQRYSFC